MQPLKYQHRRDHEGSDTRYGRDAEFQSFVGFEFLFFRVKLDHLFIILAIQLTWIKIGIAHRVNIMI